MTEYPKIVNVWKREPVEGSKKWKIVENAWSTPELEYLKDLNWSWTEKVDGTNIRIIYDGEKVEFKGKTDRAILYKPLEDFLATKFYAGALSEIFEGPVCLYGEGYGKKIQKRGGLYNPDGNSFVLFDIKIGDYWLKRKDIVEIADKLQIEVVPEVGCGTLEDAITFVRNGVYSEWGDFLAEGIVVKPDVNLLNRSGRRIITKIKTVDFYESDRERADRLVKNLSIPIETKESTLHFP